MYLAIFRSRKRAGFDEAAYAADADRMEALARAHKGFVAFRTYKAEDGETLSMSEWQTQEDARAWAHNLDHVQVQARGRNEFYETYTVYSCNEPTVRQFDRGQRR